MRFGVMVRTTAFSVVLVVAATSLLSGCGGGDSTADVKPIETGILKKLGSANQAQSDAAKDNKSARTKKRP